MSLMQRARRRVSLDGLVLFIEDATVDATSSGRDARNAVPAGSMRTPRAVVAEASQ